MSTNSSVLILDDDRAILKTLVRLLSDDYRVYGFTEAKEVKQLLSEEKIDVMLLDYMLENDDGMKLLVEFKDIYPDMEIIMITGYGEIETAVEAIKSGAYDYLTKPFNSDVIENLIKNVMKKRDYEKLAKRLKEQVESTYNLNRLVGQSIKMKNLKELVDKAQLVDFNMLLIGESGTGKELISRIIHAGSKRANGPFLQFSCGAISKENMDSELFGQSEGLASEKIGIFDAAENGTIFFDEITDIPLEAQEKIFRVIEEGEFKPAGATKPKKNLARVIAATNKNEEKIHEGGVLHKGLYEKLNSFPIFIAPLRERIGDVRELATYFLPQKAQRLNKKLDNFTENTLKQLAAYSWPGNVRQLENVIERVAILEDSLEVTSKYLPPEIVDASLITSSNDIEFSYRDYMKMRNCQAAKAYLQSALKKAGGNVTKAATMAGMKRESFHRLMKKNR